MADRNEPYRFPATECPMCGERLDAATGVRDEGPPEDDGGSVTICMYCSALLVFEPGGLRVMTTREFEELPDELKIDIAKAAVAAKRAREHKKAREN